MVIDAPRLRRLHNNHTIRVHTPAYAIMTLTVTLAESVKQDDLAPMRKLSTRRHGFSHRWLPFLTQHGTAGIESSKNETLTAMVIILTEKRLYSLMAGVARWFKRCSVHQFRWHVAEAALQGYIPPIMPWIQPPCAVLAFKPFHTPTLIWVPLSSPVPVVNWSTELPCAYSWLVV